MHLIVRSLVIGATIWQILSLEAKADPENGQPKDRQECEVRLSPKGAPMRFKSKFKVPNSEALAPAEAVIYVPLEVRSDSKGEKGVFAMEAMVKGTVVGRDGGTVVTSTEDAPRRNVAVLIDENLLLAPADYDNLESLWFLNHSCDSNLARIGGLVYVTKRDIAAGEELTIDYAPLISEHGEWRMNCECGAPGCRKVITGRDWQKPELQKSLWSEWLPFIQRKIKP